LNNSSLLKKCGILAIFVFLPVSFNFLFFKFFVEGNYFPLKALSSVFVGKILSFFLIFDLEGISSLV
jgi:hypothetical protein